LDLNISHITNKFEFNIFRKPTCTDTIIPETSNQSRSIKMSAIHSMLHRLISIPLNSSNYNKEIDTIKQIVRNNGYDTSIVDKLIFRKNKNQM